jgi:hypothetical protein
VPIQNLPARGLGGDRLAPAQAPGRLADKGQEVVSLRVGQVQVEVEVEVCADDGVAAQIRQQVRQPARALAGVKVCDDLDEFG